MRTKSAASAAMVSRTPINSSMPALTRERICRPGNVTTGRSWYSDSRVVLPPDQPGVSSETSPIVLSAWYSSVWARALPRSLAISVIRVIDSPVA